MQIKLNNKNSGRRNQRFFFFNGRSQRISKVYATKGTHKMKDKNIKSVNISNEQTFV